MKLGRRGEAVAVAGCIVRGVSECREALCAGGAGERELGERRAVGGARKGCALRERVAWEGRGDRCGLINGGELVELALSFRGVAFVLVLHLRDLTADIVEGTLVELRAGEVRVQAEALLGDCVLADGDVATGGGL